MEFLEYYKEMKDTIQEIKQLDSDIYYNMGKHSQFIIDYFERLTENIDEEIFNAGAELYHLENVLEIYNPAKKEDIEILEQLKEKLNRLTRVSL